MQRNLMVVVVSVLSLAVVALIPGPNPLTADAVLASRLPAVPTPPSVPAPASESGWSIQSLEGSTVIFSDATDAGSPCYHPDVRQTLCFRADSYSYDGISPIILFLRFPSEWIVTDVVDAGPTICDNGGTFADEFGLYNIAPNEIGITHGWELPNPVDHCWTTYCVEVITSEVITSTVSWYWYGESEEAQPHSACSSDTYVPVAVGLKTCERWGGPPASVPRCTAELSITKRLLSGAASPGDTMLFEVIVDNAGLADATDVAVTDDATTLTGPGTLVYLSPEADSLVVPAGNSRRLLSAVQVDEVAQPGDVITNCAHLRAGLAGDLLGESCATLTVAGGADLAVHAIGPGTAAPGESLLYTVTVHNRGPAGAQSVVVTGTLPSGVIPDGPATWTLGPLAAGQTVTRTVSAHLDPAICHQGELIYQVAVGSITPDPDPLDNSAVWRTTIIDAATLTLAKVLPSGSVEAGDTVPFTLTVTNTGPGCARDVQVIDELDGGSNPAGLALEAYDAVTSTQGDGAGPLPAGSWYACSGGGICLRGAAMPPGTTDTLVLTARVPASAAPGVYQNNADVVWDSGSTTAQAEYQVDAVADLHITKTALQDSVCAGSGGLVALVVTNAGPSDAEQVVVTDVLPTGMSYTGGAGCAAVGSAVTCMLERLAAGASWTFLVGFETDADIADGTVLSNTASVTATTTDPIPANNTSEAATITVVQCALPEADLRVAKTVPDSWTAGVSGQVWITVTNTGPGAAEGVTILDPALNGMTLQSFVAFDAGGAPNAAWMCDDGVRCVRSGVLPAAASETLVLTHTLPSNMAAHAGDVVTNTVYGTALNPDPNPADNWGQATYVIDSRSALEIEKHAWVEHLVAGGEAGTYSILVRNSGPSDALNVQVIDTTDPGLVLQGLTPGAGVPVACAAGACAVSLLPAGQVTQILARAAAPAGTPSGTYTNTACLVMPAGSGTTGSVTLSTADTAGVLDAGGLIVGGCAEAPVQVLANADLAVHQNAPPVVTAGEPLTYTLQVMNNGPSVARGVVVTATLPAGVLFDHGAGDAACTAGELGEVVCSSPLPGGLDPGGALSFTIFVTTSSDLAPGTSLMNRAVAAAETRDPVPLNNTASVSTSVIGAANLVLDTQGPETVVAGEPITYVITLTNTGPSSARLVEVHDMLPTGVTLTDAEIVRKGSAPLPCGSASCRIGDVANGEVVTITLVGWVDPSLVAGTTLHNWGMAFSRSTETAFDNNVDTVTTQVMTRAELSLTKTDMPDPVVAGMILAYEITIQNHGPSDASSVVVTDTVPMGTVFAGASGVCVEGGGVVTCTLGTLAAGEERALILQVHVDADLADGSVITNTAYGTAHHAERVTATAATTVRQGTDNLSDLAISKTGPDLLTASAPLTYTLVVTNQGPVTADLVDVTDALPDGLDLIGAAIRRSGSGPAVCVGATCRLQGLQVGEVATMTVVAEVGPGLAPGSDQTNVAMVFTDAHDPNLDNNQAAHVARYPKYTLFVPFISGYRGGN